MEFLGIGPLELFFIIIIALIVLGPKDMVKAGRTLGQVLRRIVTSPTWRTVQETSREIRYLPNRLMREAGLEELKETLPDVQQIRNEIGLDQVKKDMDLWQKDISDWTTPPPTIDTPPAPPDTSGIPASTPDPEEENPDG